MLKLIGWLIIFLILLLFFGLAATIYGGLCCRLRKAITAGRSRRYPEISLCSPRPSALRFLVRLREAEGMPSLETQRHMHPSLGSLVLRVLGLEEEVLVSG
jgi:hypothetical protein